MINGQHISVIIPVLNEELSIASVIWDIPKPVDRILVVDNGSVDRTCERSLAAGAEVISETRKGYGSACMAGVEAAGDTDIIAFVDGDYSDYPEDLASVLEPVAEGLSDLVIGCRKFPAEVRYRQRTGKSKISGTIKGSVMAGYKILYWTLRLILSPRKANRSSSHS